MDFREKYWADSEESLRAAIDGLRKHMWSALPVIVAEDSDGHTVTLQVAIQGSNIDPDGNVTYVNYPLLQDVPVHFPTGGGLTLTHPIKKGDEGLAVFSSRAQDVWHQSGGLQKPIDTRMHSLSDARYIPGGRSDPRKLNPPPSTVSAQLRSDDQQHFLDVHPQNGLTLTSKKAITHNAPTINDNTGQVRDLYVNDLHVKITTTQVLLGKINGAMSPVLTVDGPSDVVYASVG